MRSGVVRARRAQGAWRGVVLVAAVALALVAGTSTGACGAEAAASPAGPRAGGDAAADAACRAALIAALQGEVDALLATQRTAGLQLPFVVSQFMKGAWKARVSVATASVLGSFTLPTTFSTGNHFAGLDNGTTTAAPEGADGVCGAPPSPANEALLRFTAFMTVAVRQRLLDGLSLAWEPPVPVARGGGGGSGRRRKQRRDAVEAAVPAAGDATATATAVAAPAVFVSAPNATDRAAAPPRHLTPQPTLLRHARLAYATVTDAVRLRFPGAAGWSTTDSAGPHRVHARAHHTRGLAYLPPAPGAAAPDADVGAGPDFPGPLQQALRALYVMRVCDIEGNVIPTPQRFLSGSPQLPPASTSMLPSVSIAWLTSLPSSFMSWVAAWLPRGGSTSVTGGSSTEQLSRRVTRSSTPRPSPPHSSTSSSSSAAAAAAPTTTTELVSMRGELINAMALLRTVLDAEDPVEDVISTVMASRCGAVRVASELAGAPLVERHPWDVELVATRPFVQDAVSRLAPREPVPVAAPGGTPVRPPEPDAQDRLESLPFPLRNAVADVTATLHLPAAPACVVQLTRTTAPEVGFAQAHFPLLLFTVAMIMYRGYSGFRSASQPPPPPPLKVKKS